MGNSGSDPRAAAPREHAEIFGPHSPRNIRTRHRRATPPRHCPIDDGVDDFVHRDVDSLACQRRDALASNATGHDPVEVPHIGIDVEREPVHRSTAAQSHTDRGDLAGMIGLGLDPHARKVAQTPDLAEPEIAEDVDHDLLDRANVRNRVGHATTALARHPQHRITDELTGSVVGHISAAVGHHELRAHLRGIDQHVASIGAGTQRVDVRMLEQQQMIGRRPREQAVLQRQRVVVVDRPEPARVQRLDEGTLRRALHPNRAFR